MDGEGGCEFGGCCGDEEGGVIVMYCLLRRGRKGRKERGQGRRESRVGGGAVRAKGKGRGGERVVGERNG